MRTKIDCDYFYSDSVMMWQTGKWGATSMFTTVMCENIQSFFVEKDRC
jgi:hypothetical protein